MNRRTFTQVMATAALGVAAPPLQSKASSAAAEPDAQSSPFPLSVMLWTVFTDLPFEQRLAKVAEAGYSNVELVGEYAKVVTRRFCQSQCGAQAARHSI